MSHYLVNLRLLALSFNRYFVTIIRLNGLLLNIRPSVFTLVTHPNLLESHIAKIELVSDKDGRLIRNGHVNELKGAIRHEFEDKTL